MADRRRDKRFKFTGPAQGAFRVFPDVIVQQDGEDQWTGISRQPALPGETLVLDFVEFDEVEGEVHRRLRMHGGIMASVRFEQQVRRG
jgi:hypothetical protein